MPSLVVGSLIPDAGYYLPMPDHYKENAHTWLGAVVFGFPVGIVVLLIFYWAAPEIAFLMPSPHREALAAEIKAPTASLRGAVMAACGIVLGAETHVLWDSFTHQTGWLVEQIPLLQQPLWGNRLPVYFALQILSSVFGVCLLLYLYDRWIRTGGKQPWIWQRASWRFYVWLAVLTGCFAEAMTESRAVHGIARFHFLQSSRHFGLILVTSLIRNVLLASCALAIFAKLLRSRSAKDLPS